MAETVTVVVHPSGAADRQLTVEDAMAQILDFFELLDAAGQPQDADGQKLVWVVKSASTNSPLTLQAEAQSLDPDVPADLRARQTLARYREAWSSILNERRPPPWFNDQAERIVEKILNRSMNGIGRSDIVYDNDNAREIVTPQNAKKALVYIERLRLERPDLTHDAYGSLEGTILAATTHYGKPAFQILDRPTRRKVTCVVPEHLIDAIGMQRNFAEVWLHKSVVVAGQIHYGREGLPERIHVSSVPELEFREISLRDIKDLEFTSRLSVSDYVDQFRDGKFE